MSAREPHRLWEVGLDEVVDVELSEDERELLCVGLLEWGGATRPTDVVAQVIGFDDVETLFKDGERIRLLLRDGSPLSKRDWQRALVALEIVWASNFYGAGGDWGEGVAVGWDDQRTLKTLRQLQWRFAGLRAEPRSSDGD